MKKKIGWSDQNWTKLILFIAITIISSILLAQEDNTIIVDDSKLYFSIHGNVHKKYFNINTTKYNKMLRSYYINRIQEIGHKSHHAIAVNLPDSLLGDNLKIKKGYYAVNVDSVLSFWFVIHNFVTEINFEGGGHIGPYFNIPKIFYGRHSNLFIVSPDKKTLDKIIPIKPEASNDCEINIKIADLISEYFSINEKAFYVQYFHDIESEDVSIAQFSKEQIKKIFKLSTFYLTDDCYYIVGTSSTDHQHTFLAIVNIQTNKVRLFTNTYLYHTFLIDDEMYFYYRSVGKHSGAMVYIVSKIVDNELIKVFSDGSFSM